MLTFLKLGGSLITDKSQPHTPHKGIIERSAREIAAVRDRRPDLKLVLGHGSGSFGHVSGEKYGTRDGVESREDWSGFTRVWFDAASLNRIVIEALHAQELPAVAFPPSSAVRTRGRKITAWDLEPVKSALKHDLIPVIYGDVVFDSELGGTILSTEELFHYAASRIPPDRILLAGKEPGVWEDYPACTRLIPEIRPESLPEIQKTLGPAQDTDVTGGMGEKVIQLISLIDHFPDLQAHIFSGEQAGHITQALEGRELGTILRAAEDQGP